VPRPDEPLGSAERVRRRVGRTLVDALVGFAALAALGAWAYTGFYQLGPGEAAVILRFGAHSRTESREGLHWHLPAPIESHATLRTGVVQREDFGSARARGEGGETESAMQTSDNNIVQLGFVVQYRIQNAFQARYRLAEVSQTVRDAAQAALREVVGRNSIDDVLSEKRGAVQAEALEVLQEILDRYESGLFVEDVQLQEVQAPPPVRQAFDDVLAASQDRSRKVNEAQGHENEVIPRARAEAAEILAEADAFRDTRIAQARGEADRFVALLAEYEKAPAVTRKRLYLETMETVLPDVEKLIAPPGATAVVPWLPLGSASTGSAGAAR
jgi:membrane protease subunit HflK